MPDTFTIVLNSGTEITVAIEYYQQVVQDCSANNVTEVTNVATGEVYSLNVRNIAYVKRDAP